MKAIIKHKYFTSFHIFIGVYSKTKDLYKWRVSILLFKLETNIGKFNFCV